MKKKNGATALTCQNIGQYNFNSNACIKEGESCVETNQCSKVKFNAHNICQNLITSTNNNICLAFGDSCIEMDSDEYEQAKEYSNPYNGEKETENNSNDIDNDHGNNYNITDDSNDSNDSNNTLSLSIYIPLILFILIFY